MAADWLIRTFAPTWLDKAGLLQASAGELIERMIAVGRDVAA